MKKIWAVLALTIVFLTPTIVKAEEVDPCWDGNCSYNVNATTGQTTITRLSDAEIALRNSYVAPVIPSPEPIPSSEPTYNLVVITEEQSFGTSGTVQQLETVVQDLEQKAVSAEESKYDEPCLYTDCVKYVADGTKGTVEVVDITYRELRNRQIERLANVERTQSLATQARKIFTEITTKAKEILLEIKTISESILPIIDSTQEGN